MIRINILFSHSILRLAVVAGVNLQSSRAAHISLQHTFSFKYLFT